jgi:arylsulfatase A-like enzyme
MNAPELKRKKVSPLDSDTWAVDLALKLFEKEKPEIMLINLPLTDKTGHSTGGITDKPSMAQVINNVDVQVGRLIGAYKQAGIYDQTIFVITSDHGMTPNLHTLDDKQIVSILSSYPGKGTGRVDYYLNNPAKAGEAAEKIAQLQLQGIHGVYYKLKNQDGTYSYFPAPTTLKSIDSQLDACYRYLASTYASAQGPDLVYFTAETWKSSTSTYIGDHSTATWDNQHIPLIISGPGIKKGITSMAPARLVDIAPTVLAAMGLRPERMDGVVLADALLSPSSEFIKLQQATNNRLNPLKEALLNQHFKDMR